MQFTDEHLNQLIDGELSPIEETQLRTAMAEDAELAERFASLALVNTRYQNSVASIDDLPMPDSVLSLLTDNPTHTNTNQSEPAKSHRKTSPWQWLGGAMVKPVSPPPTMAMAFTFLMLGVAAVFVFQPSFDDNQLAHMDPMRATQYGVLEHSNPVSNILSNTPSGSSQILEKNSVFSITPVLSFAGATGNFCREYTLSNPEASYRAVACQQDSGWRVVLSSRSDSIINADQYQTASAVTPNVFEEKINQIIHGDPLSYQQELLLIERGWKAKFSNSNEGSVTESK